MTIGPKLCYLCLAAGENVPAIWRHSQDYLCESCRVDEGVNITACVPVIAETGRTETAEALQKDPNEVAFEPMCIPRRKCERGCGTVLHTQNRSGVCHACTLKSLEVYDGPPKNQKKSNLFHTMKNCAGDGCRRKVGKDRKGDLCFYCERKERIRASIRASIQETSETEVKETTAVPKAKVFCQTKCKCGCGEFMLAAAVSKGKQYIHGHTPKSKKAVPVPEAKPTEPTSTIIERPTISDQPDTDLDIHPKSAAASLRVSEEQLVNMFRGLPMDDKVSCIQHWLDQA